MGNCESFSLPPPNNLLNLNSFCVLTEAGSKFGKIGFQACQFVMDAWIILVILQPNDLKHLNAARDCRTIQVDRDFKWDIARSALFRELFSRRNCEPTC